MMKKNNSLYLEHILNSIILILDYTKGMSEKDFLENKLIQDASIRNFEIIGEAAKNISNNFKVKYPKIEWKKMAGMRDKLIHDYIGVDLWAVWAVIENTLPGLKSEISQLLK